MDERDKRVSQRERDPLITHDHEVSDWWVCVPYAILLALLVVSVVVLWSRWP